MSFVDMALSLSCDRKRLTWWAPGPDLTIGGETGETEGVRPSADSGEEVTLSKASEVVSGNIDN